MIFERIDLFRAIEQMSMSGACFLYHKPVGKMCIVPEFPGVLDNWRSHLAGVIDGLEEVEIQKALGLSSQCVKGILKLLKLLTQILIK
jgi:hypothetical protein